VRGMIRRGLRLELVAGLGMALALCVMPVAVANAQSVATETALTVSTHDQGGQTKATVSVTVTGADGQPATGSVAINEGGRQLAGVALDGEGQATSEIALLGGAHSLRAVYTGDATHLASTSVPATVQGTPTSTPTFQVSLAAVAPSALPLVLTAGSAGTLKVTVTPQYNSSLAAPMFVTLSCSGLPNQAACTFAPDVVQILATTPASCTTGSPASACPPTSTLVVQTQAATTTATSKPTAHPGSNSVAWALLLPGALGLGGLAWGARRRRWLNRLALVALVGFVTMLGTTACNPRYYYLNHGPGSSPATPSGTYTITVTGQTSDGVTALAQSTTMVLTVQ